MHSVRKDNKNNSQINIFYKYRFIEFNKSQQTECSTLYWNNFTILLGITGMQ